MARPRSLPSLHPVDPNPQGPAAANNEANQKISALEEELAKLRVQIAQIVLAQERSTQSGESNTPAPNYLLLCTACTGLLSTPQPSVMPHGWH